MCGIHGFSFQDKILAEKMVRACRHRGPDDSGIILDKEMSLGHNRLAIIDLSKRARQPMQNSDKSLTIVYNGEIYNFKALRSRLTEKGYLFNSDSDTEVILACYQEYGERCVEMLNGIFAFAIWDRKRKELFLARDHLGIKPLYYYFDGKKFIFSSEIKAILEHDVPRILNREAFNHYFRVLYVPSPLTMFKDIYKLPPASRARFKDNKLDIISYWQPLRSNYSAQTKTEFKAGVRAQVLNSVKRQLISDKPLGIYLSGGIDSSIILAAMKREVDQIDTFSVGFTLKESEQREKFNADFELAKKTARYFGTNHHEVLLSENDVSENLERVVYQMDEPISNPTALAMYQLARFTKNKVDVALSGDGGDELFGGYPRYRYAMLASHYQKLPASLRHVLGAVSGRFKMLGAKPGLEQYAVFHFQKNKSLARVLSGQIFDPEIAYGFWEQRYFSDPIASTALEQLMGADRRSWLPDYLLMLADKMAMASGLEVRVPFLDKDLVELACRIPTEHKVSATRSKIILKDAFRDVIPEYLFDQPKRGWFSPGAKWLRYPKVYEMARNVLSEEYYPQTAELFNWDELQNILKKHYNKEQYNLTILWSVLTFQIWAREYKIRS